jgi:hypothetical protein
MGAGSNFSSVWSNWAPLSLLDWGQDADRVWCIHGELGWGFTGIVRFAYLVASVEAKWVDGWNSVLVAFL